MKEIERGVFLKKSFDGWRVVYPARNSDGTLNWFNIFTGGNYWNLIKVGLIISLILFGVWSYKRDLGMCVEVIENPCLYCDRQLDFPQEINVLVGLDEGIFHPSEP